MEPLMINAKDITAIVDNDLCHSCGACANVCHPEVISFHETTAGHILPQINYDGCTACELCSAVCPGVIFGETMTETLETVEDPFAGTVLSTWVGQSKNKDILNNGQSGGVASAIILHALENKIIDTAIVAVMSNNGTIHGDVILAYNQEDIVRSQQSKYIPISLLTALSKVKERKERFAIVGLSCHIHGLHNVLDIKPSLKKKFIFSIGLICDRVMVNAGMDYLIHKTNIEKEDVTEFYFRDKRPHGYPGYVHIKTFEKSYTLPPEERIRIKDYFTPARCRICFDKMNIGADITVGDPHGIKGVDRVNGESLVISRTAKGEEILNVVDNIQLRLEDPKSVLIGQNIEYKKKDWRAYIERWRELQKPIPEYYTYVRKFTKNEYGKIYNKNLTQALSLRFFNTRNELFIEYVKQMKKQTLKNKLLSPLILTKRIMSKIKRNLAKR